MSNEWNFRSQQGRSSGSQQQNNIQQPDQIMISLLDISDYNNFNISCYGSNDGYIDISIQGGVTAYQYNWSNGSTNQDLTDLIAGNYMVTVTDANNWIKRNIFYFLFFRLLRSD